MCGICGFLNLDETPVDASALGKMTRLLAHRGPDGEGTWTGEGIGLGHRRLAIIDLSSAAAQPMVSADGRFVLSYNGEVYNFRELRMDLERAGRVFRSRSDSEVVLEALAAWGEEALPRFNGMFALALWDRRERTLLLARDRYGIKPLYVTERAGALLFASEAKALFAHPACPAALDPEALVEYFTFQNLFSDRTLFEGVRLLPAGTCLRAAAGEGRAGEPRRWWDFRFEETAGADERETVEELRRLFRQAVTRQLVSDVPVGAYLSGGIDSSSIAAVAAPAVPGFATFTVGFDMLSASGLELGFDERDRARRYAEFFGTTHHETVLVSGDMERALPPMTGALDEPRVGQSYPNWYAARLAAGSVKVVLSGTGGDELFGGYPWRYYRAVVNDGFDAYVDRYFSYWQRLLPPEEQASFFAPLGAAARSVDPRALFRSVFRGERTAPSRPEEYVQLSLDFEARTFLHGLLFVEDKLSMAHGLETRLPFLDNDLVDFAQRIPARMKLGRLDEIARMNENEPGSKTAKYFQRHHDGKIVLRRAMESFVPAEAVSAPKQGFSAPDASWFRGESIEYVRRRLYSPGTRLYNFLDRETVRRLVGRHLEGGENLRLLIWSLLSFESWCERFLDG